MVGIIIVLIVLIAGAIFLVREKTSAPRETTTGSETAQNSDEFDDIERDANSFTVESTASIEENIE